MGLVSLAYLWQRDQKLLLKEMLQAGVSAVIIKVACLGLKPTKHLGRSLEEVYPYLCELVCIYVYHILYVCALSVDVSYTWIIWQIKYLVNYTVKILLMRF